MQQDSSMMEMIKMNIHQMICTDKNSKRVLQ